MTQAIDNSGLLAAMKVMAANASRGVEDIPSGEGVSAFSGLLSKAINHVNDAQMASGKLAEAFERGDPNVDLPSLMVAMQKASLSYEALKQVRNRLVDAYEEINRMGV